MSRHIVIFTPRSGSMLLTDLISHAYKVKNYGEPWTFNADDIDVTQLYIFGRFPNNIKALHHYYSERERRLAVLLRNESWVAKLGTIQASSHCSRFLDKCRDNEINVWMTHRRNIVDQFLSYVNAAYRQQYVFSNKIPVPTNTCVDWPSRDITRLLIVFTQLLTHWRQIYDKHKGHVRLVSYEDDIRQYNLLKFGITNNMIEEYNSTETHIVPTPNNVPLKDQQVWKMCVDILKRHQHLVEIE